MARTHEQNLECIRWNLSSARATAEHRPSDWNTGRVERLRQAESDYLRLMSGEITRSEMCPTAQELTMTMTEWGTRGT